MRVGMHQQTPCRHNGTPVAAEQLHPQCVWLQWAEGVHHIQEELLRGGSGNGTAGLCVAETGQERGRVFDVAEFTEVPEDGVVVWGVLVVDVKVVVAGDGENVGEGGGEGCYVDVAGVEVVVFEEGVGPSKEATEQLVGG